MTRYFLLFFCLLAGCLRLDAALSPEQVAVVYNADSPLSREAMEKYCLLRKIPTEQVFALHALSAQDISRADFDVKVRMDLLLQAKQRSIMWPGGARKGRKLLRALVLMPDLPLRVKEDPSQPAGRISDSTPGNSASLDAELMLLGCDFPIGGPLNNPCYMKKVSELSSELPVLAVCRIDGPDRESIFRLIEVPHRVEPTGLWGWVAVDQGGPYASGDAKFAEIAGMAKFRHQPLFIEDSKRTLPETFPLMPQTIAYFGWYANPANGPFRPESAGNFRFAPGAIGLHLHSYSGTSVKDKHTWVGALLHRGAAVTAGNVAEPLLSGCLDFAAFYRALLEGSCVAEAGLSATPYLSWQNVLLGDPLYRPFPAQPARRPAADNPFLMWKDFCIRHGASPAAMQSAVEQQFRGRNAGLFAEMLAWRYAENKEYSQAVHYFKMAARLYRDGRDVTRVLLLQLAAMPAAGQRAAAQKYAADWKKTSVGSTYAPAISAVADALNPPPPQAAGAGTAKGAGKK